MNPITIIIADDHEIFRHGLASVFRDYPDIELVDQASNGKFLIGQVKQHRPDVVLTDIQMDEIDGIEATKYICKNFPTTVVIAMSMHEDDYTIMEMLKAGAAGYLIKKAPKHVLIEAIRSAHSREQYYCRESSRRVSALISSRRFDPKNMDKVDFTATEIRIIRMICEDMVNKQIADELGISIHTVAKHRVSIFEKADVKSTAGLMLYAIRNGMYKV